MSIWHNLKKFKWHNVNYKRTSFIFGGIVRCDRVANGIVDAYKNLGDKINIPIIVRLQGTNSIEAKKIIDNSGLKIYSAVEFNEVPAKIKEVLL